MKGALIFGTNRDYRRIATDDATIRRGIIELHGDMNPEKLLEGLSMPESIPASHYGVYGGSSKLEMTQDKLPLPDCIISFFGRAEAEREKHKADEVYIHNLSFWVPSHGSVSVSADITLFLKDREI